MGGKKGETQRDITWVDSIPEIIMISVLISIMIIEGISMGAIFGDNQGAKDNIEWLKLGNNSIEQRKQQGILGMGVAVIYLFFFGFIYLFTRHLTNNINTYTSIAMMVCFFQLIVSGLYMGIDDANYEGKYTLSVIQVCTNAVLIIFIGIVNFNRFER